MKEILNYTLLQFGDFNFKLSTIFKFALFIVIIFVLLYVIKKTIYKAVHIDVAKKYSIYSLIKYFVIIFSFIISLQIFGFNLSVLIAGSAALLVGLGLGLQNLFSDFISGIIILIDSSVKVNDIIEVNGIVCQVQEIDIRTTTVLTRDDKYIILPNSDLTRNQLINWTHSKISSRFEITVGVDYSSDVKLVMNILKEAADKQNGVLTTPSPFVRFTDFGDSSLNFSVIFWSEEVFRVENIKSEIRIRIFELFNSNDITIPFPQRVVQINKE
ncbi:small-conductance mechanosensitive channel [Flavobacterium sp. CG_23.5]|uniref:mechanosensitive ion channel family protein n=1 Tax=unclassified Flavobacterium TaxID=196869 RepID=UPI0018C9BD08|nr:MULTISPECIES: mechanosensitive ion channel domain-containing protein [unclassified Flavobacterium]MBG6109658.1 small-conductance mechanosensitive channel [Flavobacterium sp. CG_9.10]MBP2284692.1 small-conductance mechanosensitive channel [Flavobacterium sp. CG_23.5]